jgi:hypothetical protein
VIYAVHVKGEILGLAETADISKWMRERLLSRGEIATDVVIAQRETKETLSFLERPIQYPASVPRCSTRR